MNGNTLLAIFAISALLVGIPTTNFAYADDSSEKDDDRKEKMEKERELKKELKEKQKEEHKEKIEKAQELKKELRKEYHKKLEEKKKVFADYRKDLKNKFHDLKKEFKEKYAQLRITSISDIDKDSNEKIEDEIKHKELRLLKHEFREKIKNLKLEAKQHFDELKIQLDEKQTDRKNKIHDRIKELKEKYKNKIKQHDHTDVSDLDKYSTDYENKKIDICHVPPGNTENVQTLTISVNALRAHLAHGDYIDTCESDDETDTETTTTGGDATNDANVEGEKITVELKEELGISQQ